MTNGFLLVNKTGGMTSHDVVAKVRKRFGTKKVGHAGTLDPMATGVLVLGIGNATRLLQYVTDGRKGYEAIISLGKATVTDDVEGEVIFKADPLKLSVITDEQIKKILEAMVGEISQRPSSVSAIKVDGKTAHQRVREGEIVELPPRDVTIYELTITSIERSEDSIEIHVGVECSAGTYIRAIARDLGESLGVGGHLIKLRRYLVSPFRIEESAEWESAEMMSTAAGIGKILPSRTLDMTEISEISFGRTITLNSHDGVVAALTPDGDFAGLLRNENSGGCLVATPIMVSVKE